MTLTTKKAAYIAKFAEFVWFVWLCSNVQTVHCTTACHPVKNYRILLNKSFKHHDYNSQPIYIHIVNSM